MANELTIVMAQLNPLVGDITGNTQKVIQSACDAYAQYSADVVVFSELVLTGYPPEDLLLRPSLKLRIDQAIEQLMSELPDCFVVVGYPRHDELGEGELYNMAGVFKGGKLLHEYAKQHLPNYRVFDEHRYFVPGDQSCVIDINGVSAALSICEDIWHPQPMEKAKELGAQLMLNLNASPFHVCKQEKREAMLAERVAESGIPIIYVNQVGGQDELVFDGGSVAVDSKGEVCYRAPAYKEGLHGIQFREGDLKALSDGSVDLPELLPSVYNALVLGVRDYTNKNGFKSTVLGLSGGIDSALTLAVAADALGKDRVNAVMMPFRYTSQQSCDEAAEEARLLGVNYQSISIEPIYESFMQALVDDFAGIPADTTEENLQARCRGVLLMSLSNKHGHLVLTTGNKSEMAVGYSTLYGDMAGGFDVLKDVPKTLVYELAKYRNTLSHVIPEGVITRAPSAELAPDQEDQDSLPPYDELDQILQLYVEQDVSLNDIVKQGFDEAVVRRVVRMVDINEYKRRQAPIGVRITERGFGRDRRYPITSGWKPGE